jgi:RimJ/RimL family protein N-acetyltransferase
MKEPFIDQPQLLTRRLRLRPYNLSDATEMVRLVNDREVARHTLIPYPYSKDMAEAWIGTHVPRFLQGARVTYAVTRLEDSQMIGTVALGIDPSHDKADLHYRFGKEFWNQGYATEAAQRLMQYGFETLALHRVQASHSTNNHASGRVLRKLGMRYEGRMRHALKRWDMYDDLDLYAIVAEDISDAVAAQSD